MDRTELVPFVTDLTYGLLMISGITIAQLTGWGPAIGYMIGICIGYAVHAGSNMASFSTTVADGSDD